MNEGYIFAQNGMEESVKTYNLGASLSRTISHENNLTFASMSNRVRVIRHIVYVVNIY